MSSAASRNNVGPNDDRVPLDPREAFRMWAADYRENPVTHLDQVALRELCPDLDGAALLDVGCGPARRLPVPGKGSVRLAVGIDLSVAMLRAAEGHRGRLVAATVEAIPLGTALFDVVWCRLTLGYVQDLRGAYEELARVTRVGGRVVVTDLHSAAVRAGHTRSFRDTAGITHVVRSYVHEPEHHSGSATAAGLRPQRRLDLSIGPDVRSFYQAADRLDRYERDRNLSLVLAWSFTR
ncbi:MAG TPA: class I SAM-dependent methyltransferase [Gemmatimonadaceae bacterium]|nr:class I SAM-dependent methyltransferase [Gemmatimonadaceae bacterium]